jgi:hypothetical protein
MRQRLETLIFCAEHNGQLRTGEDIDVAAECVSKKWESICRNPNFSGLLAARRIGFRNGNWRKLSLVDRGLFRCALWVSRVHGGIESLKLLVRVLGIALKLLEKSQVHIWKMGKARAEELMRQFENRGVFGWAPQIRGWLVETSYIFCLGLRELY